jgi:hypothetical protein
MIVVLNKGSMDFDLWTERANQYPKNKVRVFKLPEKYTLGKCLNYAISKPAAVSSLSSMMMIITGPNI